MPFFRVYILYKFPAHRLGGVPTQKGTAIFCSPFFAFTLCILPRSAIGIHAIYVPLHIYHHAVIQHQI